ncbi:tRNA (guanosine(37)-N1)-methyltransferase TrmD [Candidatus Gottesmanbacteria bacterium]|nr:tRNA (guanosine(37)-N1)-methyltransferase TrmD [Candidatus Gottesmanbacteria bacterium]
MKFTILSLFPEMFVGPFNYSIIKKAAAKKLIEINLVNIRDFATDKYKTVDDKPYGGGAGMIMKVDIINKAIQKVKSPAFVKTSAGRQKSKVKSKERVILLDPKGKLFTQRDAKRLKKYEHLIFVCGHYEGVDARVSKLVDEVISVGNYVLTGGEIPTMIIVDAVTRLVPGVIKKESAENESFTDALLEYPQYTRPAEYKRMKVPKILLSGNHEEIKKWREKHEKRIIY